MTRWDQRACVSIMWLVILFKNAPTLFLSTGHSKNGELTGTIGNIMTAISVSKITNLMDTAFSITNRKLADSAIFSSSWTEVSISCNDFN